MGDIKFLDANRLSVSNKDSFAHYSKSENNQYIFAWWDGYVIEDNDGNETWIPGAYILFENEKEILHGVLERPDNGMVANNGSFTVVDYFFDNDLSSLFLAFSKEGKKLLNHRFSANVKTTLESSDGKYALCQLYDSDSSDANNLILFDLEAGEILWQKVPETWVADFIELDFQNRDIYLGYEYWKKSEGEDERIEQIKFRYKFDGTFVDQDSWYNFRIQQGNGFQIMKIADEKNVECDYGNEDLIQDVLGLYFLAAERLVDNPYFGAQAHRKIAEIYEILDNVQKAIEHYRIALSLNSKIGVKRKLKKLEEIVE